MVSKMMVVDEQSCMTFYINCITLMLMWSIL
jgi:hypothetical protein